ncbi:glycosyltransferase family 2 protein [Helicobacter ibis]|uniref:Glycosyltransferase family A protein n=1 Tax=Helicobacter ibis TaxID=2962633 RepID=A0ABT4VDU8_9HELI|nr:glycosyltransferase family A protein [Helicobacter ibis]MDA3968863.1 glycosyltransferase family A protein [Helicobacter ibis]
MNHSIIVPIYNVENYLKECLDSIINQSYKDFELILVNDGSTDNSLKIAMQYAKQDSRIIIIDKPNGGLSSARNAGLEFIKPLREKLQQALKAKTGIQTLSEVNSFNKQKKNIDINTLNKHFTFSKNLIKTDLENVNSILLQEMPNDHFIQFVDSDDMIDINATKCIRDNESELTIFQVKSTNEKGEVIKNMLSEQFHYVENYKNGMEIAHIVLQRTGYSFYFAYQGGFKAEVLNRYNLRFTHNIMHEDNDFGLILCMLSQEVKMLKDEMYIYRIREGSITSYIDKKTEIPMPKKLPPYLQKVRDKFPDLTYLKIRGAYRIYSYLIIYLNIYKFLENGGVNSWVNKSYYRLLYTWLNQYRYIIELLDENEKRDLLHILMHTNEKYLNLSQNIDKVLSQG